MFHMRAGVRPMQVEQVVVEGELFVELDAPKIEELFLLGELAASIRLQRGDCKAPSTLIRAPPRCRVAATDSRGAEGVEQAGVQPRCRRLRKARHEECRENGSAMRRRNWVEASHLLGTFQLHCMLWHKCHRSIPRRGGLGAAVHIDEAGQCRRSCYESSSVGFTITFSG